MSKDNEKVLVTPKQVGELCAVACRGINSNIDIIGPQADRLISKPDEFNALMRQVFTGPQRNEQDLEFIELQQKFYKEMFGKVVDFTHTYLPNPQDSLTFPFGIVQGMYDPLVWATVNEAIGLYTDISDKDLKNMISDRTPYKNYFIRQEFSIEPNPALKNLSWNALRERNIHTQTSHEHGLFTLFVWWWKKEHLDVKNVTICGASRLADGDIPHVYWDGDKVDFNWGAAGDAHDGWRGRAVVS